MVECNREYNRLTTTYTHVSVAVMSSGWIGSIAVIEIIRDFDLLFKNGQNNIHVFLHLPKLRLLRNQIIITSNLFLFFYNKPKLFIRTSPKLKINRAHATFPANSVF